MFVRMVLGKLSPGTWDEHQLHYQERVVNLPSPIKGLRERQSLRSTEDSDEGISVSLWDTLEDLRR